MSCMKEVYALVNERCDHFSNSPILAQDERPEMYGRYMANLLESERSKTVNTPNVLVYGFRGQRYFAKPGTTFVPKEVCEDFGDWRPSKTEDGKATQKWLVKHGYRKVWYKTVADGSVSAYEEYWCHESIVGTSTEQLVIPPVVLKKLVREGTKGVEQFAKEMCGE